MMDWIKDALGAVLLCVCAALFMIYAEIFGATDPVTVGNMVVGG